MAVKKAIKKLCLQDKNAVFLVSEFEADKSLTLKIIDIKQNESYVGKATNFEFRTQAAVIRLTLSDFIHKAHKALLEKESHEQQFIYTLERDAENYIFKWKSIDEEETIINLGSVRVEKVDYVDAFDEILVDLSNSITDFNNKIQEYDVQLNDYKNQTKDALDQLSEANCIKDNLEKELYSKFLIVLNEKKRALKEAQHQNSKRSKSQNVMSNDWNNNSNDKVVEFDESRPSTSTKRISDLFLDDEEKTVSLKPSKMRNRKNIDKSGKRPCDSEVKSFSNKPIFNDESDNDEFLLGNL